jgi:hypothetical protein
MQWNEMKCCREENALADQLSNLARDHNHSFPQHLAAAAAAAAALLQGGERPG